MSSSLKMWLDNPGSTFWPFFMQTQIKKGKKEKKEFAFVFTSVGTTSGQGIIRVVAVVFVIFVVVVVATFF